MYVYIDLYTVSIFYIHFETIGATFLICSDPEITRSLHTSDICDSCR